MVLSGFPESCAVLRSAVLCSDWVEDGEGCQVGGDRSRWPGEREDSDAGDMLSSALAGSG